MKTHAPITGEQIAEMLGLSRPTLRSDLSILVMLGYIDAKPKVGYFAGKSSSADYKFIAQLAELKVKDVYSIPVVIREVSSVHDAVVMLFIENVGSLIVTDEMGFLVGIVSRKDLLKVTLGNANAAATPISLVMTRQPNLFVVEPDTPVLEAAKKLIHHQVDCLPVVSKTVQANGQEKVEVVGRITKTNMTRVLLEMAAF